MLKETCGLPGKI